MVVALAVFFSAPAVAEPDPCSWSATTFPARGSANISTDVAPYALVQGGCADATFALVVLTSDGEQVYREIKTGPGAFEGTSLELLPETAYRLVVEEADLQSGAFADFTTGTTSTSPLEPEHLALEISATRDSCDGEFCGIFQRQLAMPALPEGTQGVFDLSTDGGTLIMTELPSELNGSGPDEETWCVTPRVREQSGRWVTGIETCTPVVDLGTAPAGQGCATVKPAPQGLLGWFARR